jgi:hypothetical protein
MTAESAWTTPADVEHRLERLWESGRLLAASIGGEPVLPLRIPVRGPRPPEWGERFEEVRRWVRDLDAGSKARRGWGYDLEWVEVKNRVVGAQRVPAAIVVSTEADAWRLLGKRRETEGFRGVAARTVERFPELRDWLLRRPLLALEHALDWERILAVLCWFRDHPRPGLYLRQLEIPGVDTKFIEAHRGLLGQLLDLVLPSSSIDAAFSGASGFEGRYGLRSRPVLVRFRILDPELRLHGLSDLTVPVDELRTLAVRADRVFVTENEVNGLAFPEVPGGVVLFGLGYGIERLGDIPWLADRQLHYWGDLDTHGFAILSRFRQVFPRAASLLMDRRTLMEHRSLWVRESEPFLADLPGLTEDEQAVFDELRTDRLGRGVRLEQERIGFGWVSAALRERSGAV